MVVLRTYCSLVDSKNHSAFALPCTPPERQSHSDSQVACCNFAGVRSNPIRFFSFFFVFFPPRFTASPVRLSCFRGTERDLCGTFERTVRDMKGNPFKGGTASPRGGRAGGWAPSGRVGREEATGRSRRPGTCGARARDRFERIN